MGIGSLGILIQNICHALTTGSAKVLVQQVAPLYAVGLRTLIAGVILVSVLRVLQGRQVYKDILTHKKHVLIGAFTRILIPSTFFYWAVQYIPVAKVALFSNFKPFVTFILSYLLLGESMTRNKWIGILVGMSGVVPIIIAQQTKSEDALALVSFISIPEVVLLCAILCISYGWIKMRQALLTEPNLSSVTLTAAEAMIAGFLGTSSYLIFAGVPTIVNKQSFGFYLALTIILGAIFRRLTKGWLLKRYSATLLALGDLSYPFFAAVVGWFLFGEGIGWEFFISTALVLLGFCFFFQDERVRA